MKLSQKVTKVLETKFMGPNEDKVRKTLQEQKYPPSDREWWFYLESKRELSEHSDESSVMFLGVHTGQ